MAVLALALAAPVPPAPGLAQEPDYPALWESGQSYDEFRQEITARRSLWQRNTERADVSEDVVARARAVPGTWRLLVVAFDRCSDSVSTVPYIAELAARVDGLELRIIPPDAGRAIVAAHPTPDGRAATPTVLLLDDDWRPAGAWVEPPRSSSRGTSPTPTTCPTTITTSRRWPGTTGTPGPAPSPRSWSCWRRPGRSRSGRGRDWGLTLTRREGLPCFRGPRDSLEPAQRE